MGRRRRVGLVLGAGGITGGAWLAGTLSEIAASSGWEPGTADLVLGTSAGSVFAALIASKIPARSLRPPDDPGVEHWPLRDLTLLESYAGGEALPSAAPRALGLLVAAVASGSSWTRGSRLLNALAPRGTAPTEAIRRTVGMRVPQGWVQHPACWIVATSRATGRRVVCGRGRRGEPARAVGGVGGRVLGCGCGAGGGGLDFPAKGCISLPHFWVDVPSHFFGGWFVGVDGLSGDLHWGVVGAATCAPRCFNARGGRNAAGHPTPLAAHVL
mgnify:CR=1 FL=1